MTLVLKCFHVRCLRPDWRFRHGSHLSLDLLSRFQNFGRSSFDLLQRLFDLVWRFISKNSRFGSVDALNGFVHEVLRCRYVRDGFEGAFFQFSLYHFALHGHAALAENPVVFLVLGLFMQELRVPTGAEAIPFLGHAFGPRSQHRSSRVYLLNFCKLSMSSLLNCTLSLKRFIVINKSVEILNQLSFNSKVLLTEENLVIFDTVLYLLDSVWMVKLFWNQYDLIQRL